MTGPSWRLPVRHRPPPPPVRGIPILLASLAVLILPVCLFGQGLKEEADSLKANMREMFRVMADQEGHTNILAVMQRHMHEMGFTNVTEADLRKDPDLPAKQLFGGMLDMQQRPNLYAELRARLSARGFTNVTEEDLREDPVLYFASELRLHATLPRSELRWPPPDTNRMDGVTKFVQEHGWNMGDPGPWGRFALPNAPGTKPISGLPWPAIANRTFNAYTTNQWLVVILSPATSFGWSHSGLLYTLQTNGPPPWLQNFFTETRALGGGWYGFRYVEGGKRDRPPPPPKPPPAEDR